MTKSPFILDGYTEKEKAMFKARQQSKDKADKFFKELFNQNISWVIVANVMTEFGNKCKKSPTSFEEAWGSLDYQTVIDIVFRAVNELPCQSKDEGEMEQFLRQCHYPSLRVIN